MGGAASPATDIYAASAVFFECLTSKAPFNGRLDQLAHQHETAAVPLMEVDEPVQRIIARGMAKDPRDRPVDALAFIEELDWVAESAYGPNWERRGRTQLAGRAAALLALLFGAGVVAGGAGAALASSSMGGHSFLTSLFGGRLFPASGGVRTLGGLSKTAVIVTASVIGVAAIGGTTLALTSNNHGGTGTVASGTSAPAGGGTGTGDPGGSPAGGGSASATPTATPTATPSATPSATPGASPTAAATTKAPTTAPTTKAPTTKPPTTKPPTTKPPTTKPPTTAPAPNISVSITSNPASPDNPGACTASPTFIVTATVSSNEAVTITYSWSGTVNTGSGTAKISAGSSVTLSEDVPVPSGASSFTGDEMLSVTAPVTASSSDLQLSYSCSPIQ
jgi:serine/threonine-protein kinase